MFKVCERDQCVLTRWDSCLRCVRERERVCTWSLEGGGVCICKLCVFINLKGVCVGWCVCACVRVLKGCVVLGPNCRRFLSQGGCVGLLIDRSS